MSEQTKLHPELRAEIESQRERIGPNTSTDPAAAYELGRLDGLIVATTLIPMTQAAVAEEDTPLVVELKKKVAELEAEIERRNDDAADLLTYD